MNREHDHLIKEFLEEKFDQYNRPNFISSDPIAIPHQFSNYKDIEVSGFLAATIAWGQRAVIVSKGHEIMKLMENTPYTFIKEANKRELSQFKKFGYRTFKSSDLMYFITALHQLLKKYETLGQCFHHHYTNNMNVRDTLTAFRNDFFSHKAPGRAVKHLSNPEAGSAAKRMNMYLRWMVRKDDRGVDFGIWDFISPAALYLPLDVHTSRIGRKLGLLDRRTNDWKAVVEITHKLQGFDAQDPVKYDFALFGLGIFEKF
jgi:uncharacterized protein (TIGR02757 family)